jgi:hypothetical protein
LDALPLYFTGDIGIVLTVGTEPICLRLSRQDNAYSLQQKVEQPRR